jgi:uncharacterized ferritin-like protein (DUF455 family)
MADLGRRGNVMGSQPIAERRPTPAGMRAAADSFLRLLAEGRTLFDFPDAPWEFQLDMAWQVWDESRHAEIFIKLLEYVGSYLGEFPESEVLWSCAQVDDPACRVAGTLCHPDDLLKNVTREPLKSAIDTGDAVIERAVDYVLADEITHVRMGSKWMRKLTESDPARLKKAQDFQDNIDSLFNFQGGRTTKEDAPQVPIQVGQRQIDFDATLTISREARILAGFTDEELSVCSRPPHAVPPTDRGGNSCSE